MKKILIIIILALSVSRAQSQSLKVGIKVGANLTKVTGKAFKEAYDLGYHAGAFAEIKFTKALGIQPEVIFNQVNTNRASGVDTIFNYWKQNISSISLNYLSLPILLRINLNKLITVNLGPQFGILLNKNESLWNNGKEAIRSGDLSAVGGVTVNLKKFRAYGRYVIGLNNINDIENTDKWKSQQLQIGVGLKL